MIRRKYLNISEDDLETLVMDRVQDQAARLLEDSLDESLAQHLSICNACVESLKAIEVQLAVIQDALKNSRRDCRKSFLRRSGT